MWIDRASGKRLLALSRQFPALVLTGARQTGKTSLLRHLFPAASFVSLDLPSLAAQAEQDPAALLTGHAEPLLLDEVQYAPGLFRHLKVAIDRERHRCGRFLMTGSQKFSLMRGLSESLAGRIAVVELDTLSASELRGAGIGGSAAEQLWRGGFPELHRNPELDPREFFSSYVATYLERDVRSLLRLTSLRDFERFVRACALRSGQLLNLTELGRDLGIAGSTARDWLNILETSDQIVLLEPYFANPGKRMIKTPKLYFRDTGLLSFLLGLDSGAAAERSPFIGALWETHVLGQILRRKRATNAAANVYFWRDAHGTEVDFAIDAGGQVRLIEAKWATDPQDWRSLDKVRAELGKRGRAQHLIACRTAHAHSVPGDAGIRLVDANRYDDWFEID